MKASDLQQAEHDVNNVPAAIDSTPSEPSTAPSALGATNAPLGAVSAGDQAQWALGNIVSGLRESRERTHNVRHLGRVRELPSRAAISSVLDELCAILFPTHYGRPDLNDEDIDYFVGSTLSHALRALNEQVRRGLLFDRVGTSSADRAKDRGSLAKDAADAGAALTLQASRDRADLITRAFAAQIVPIRALLVSDLHAAFQGDPAASSISEVLLCYPGTIAIIYHRLAHALWQLGARFVARLISNIAHSTTGIDIHPAARIGASFFIDHGTGVVIGETAIIGEHVRLYQHVTLGAKRFPADDNGVLIKGNARHPIVENDVVIYAGATVLGRITIGQGSTIGGNVWLTHSVPPGSNVAQAQMRND